MSGNENTLEKNTTAGIFLVGRFTNIPLLASLIGELKLYSVDARLSDVWIAVTWST